MHRLGLQAARRILLTAATLQTDELERIGFLDGRARDATVLGSRCDAFCAELAGMAPLALLGMKRHLAALADGRFDGAAAAADSAAAAESADLREGVTAMRERRLPHFTGR